MQPFPLKFIEIFWVICWCVGGGLVRKSNIPQLAHSIFTCLQPGWKDISMKRRMRNPIKELVACHLPMLCVWTYQTLFATVCLVVCPLKHNGHTAYHTMQCSLCVLTLYVDTFNEAQCVLLAALLSPDFCLLSSHRGRSFASDIQFWAGIKNIFKKCFCTLVLHSALHCPTYAAAISAVYRRD